MSTTVIAVPEGNPSAGAIVWWQLSGSVTLELLEAAWAKEGLPAKLLPDLPGYETALRRAINEQREHRRLVRPLKGVTGWALVAESADSKTVGHRVICSITLGLDGRPKISTEGAGTFTVGGEVEAVTAQVSAAYDRHLNEISREDISGWLVWLAQTQLMSVPLRETGGIYFTPHTHVEMLDRMRRAFHEINCGRIHEVPALKSSDAVEAVLSALRAEAETEAKAMEDELTSGDLGERALNSRAIRVQAVAGKLGLYEKLLGQSLDDLRTRLGDLEAGLAAAALAAMGAKEVA